MTDAPLSTPALAAQVHADLLAGPAVPAFDRLVRLVCATLKVPKAVLAVADGDVLVYRSARGIQAPVEGRHAVPRGASPCGRPLETRAPYTVADAREDDAWKDQVPESDGAVAYAAVPIFDFEDHVVGALCALDSAPRRFGDEEISLLKELAAIAGEALATRREGLLAARREGVLCGLLDAAPTALLAMKASSPASSTATGGSDGILFANKAARALFGETAEGALKAWGEAHEVLTLDGEAIAPEASPVAHALRGEHGEPVALAFVARDGGRDRRVQRVWSAPVGGDAARPIAAVAVLEDITAQRRLEEELGKRSLTDDLTGLHSARALLALGEQHLRVAYRNQTPAVLLRIDLAPTAAAPDDDADGAVLDTAGLLRGSLRDCDIIARIGPTTFGVVASTDENGVAALGKRLDAAVERHNAASGRRTTLALETEVVVYDPKAPRTVAELLAAAERRVAARRATISTPPGPPSPA